VELPLPPLLRRIEMSGMEGFALLPGFSFPPRLFLLEGIEER